MVDVSVVPEFVEVLLFVAFFLVTMEAKMGVDHLISYGVEAGTVDEELAVGLSISVSFDGVFFNEGFHQEVSALSLIDVWNNSLVVNSLAIIRLEATIDSGALWGSDWLGGPWTLHGIWSILVDDGTLFTNLEL